jgi:hypothetical protein
LLKREKKLILQKIEKPYFHTSSQRVVGILTENWVLKKNSPTQGKPSRELPFVITKKCQLERLIFVHLHDDILLSIPIENSDCIRNELC